VRPLAGLVVALLGCRGGSPSTPVSEPPANNVLVAKVDDTSVARALEQPTENTCLSESERIARSGVIETAHDRVVKEALERAGLVTVALVQQNSRDERADAEKQPEPWTEIERGGERLLVGPGDASSCPNDEPALVAMGRHFVRRGGDIYQLQIEIVPTARVQVRACGECPTTGPGCGAYMPAWVQAFWKLPAGTHYRGIRRLRIETPQLEWVKDPPPAGCPPLQKAA